MAVWYRVLAAALAVAAAPYPADNVHPPPAWFVNVAPQAGLQMDNVNGDLHTKKYIIETTGSGVAVIDYDHDGWPDIYLVNGMILDPNDDHGSAPPTGHLYHNDHDGSF